MASKRTGKPKRRRATFAAYASAEQPRQCSRCKHTESDILQTRKVFCGNQSVVLRRRRCQACDKRWWGRFPMPESQWQKRELGEYVVAQQKGGE